MRTALTVITTAILTAIAFLFAWQEGRLGTSALSGAAVASCPTPSTETGTADDGTCLSVEEGASCTAPWGDQVLHGEAILSFEQEIASGDISCDGRTSICDDGVWLNEVSPFAFTTCSYGDGVGISVVENNCAVGGVMVPHDSTNTFYKEKKNGSTYTYEAQKRYCFDGQLDGDAAYNKLNLISSCTLEIKEEVVVEIPQPVVQPVRAPVVTQPQEPVYARCTGPFGGVWQHGQGGTAYLASNVGYGSSCEAVNIVCGYGSIRFGTEGNIGQPVGQQLYGSCSVGEPAGCSTACGQLAHGENITTYSTSQIPYGSDQTCGEATITSTCTNGSVSPSAGTACSCKQLPPAGCVAANGQTVSHESSLTLYQYPQVQALAGDGSDTCVRQWRQCKNGTFHDRNGNPAAFTFRHTSCEVLPPPAGGGSGGEGVPQG